jgi:uncharacterized protein (TIGR02284 family)
MTTDQNKVLSHLIDVCVDAKNFYDSAAEKADDAYVEGVFHEMASIRSNIIVDLKAYVNSHGGRVESGTLENGGTLSGKTSQFFGELLADVTPNVDKTLVDRLEEAEDRSLDEFRKAIDKDIPAEAKALVSEQLSTLRETHDNMKQLKDRLHTGA